MVLSRLPLVRMSLALQQRAARLGDSTGAILLASLTSDIGHPVGRVVQLFMEYPVLVLFDMVSDCFERSIIAVRDMRTHCLEILGCVMLYEWVLGCAFLF